MTIFERIAAREIPARILHETNDWLAFHDVHPQAPVHVLVIPKRPIARLDQTTRDDAALLGEMLQAIPALARQLGIAESGYRVVINNGPDAGESVPHLHIHLLGGKITPVAAGMIAIRVPMWVPNQWRSAVRDP